MRLTTLECGFREDGLGKQLSNLYPRRFVFRGLVFASMEGFLQSLKVNGGKEAAQLRKLSGVKAWREGQIYNPNWQQKQILYFKGREYERRSEAYYNLVRAAYLAQFLQNVEFEDVLYESFPKALTHSFGKVGTHNTTLTMFEYLANLEYLRALSLRRRIREEYWHS